LKSEKPVVMDMENGHFESLADLGNCMHASCLLPGIAGPVMNIKVKGDSIAKPKFVIRNNLNDPDYEPLGDALIYAPLPYDIAQKDGATHVIVIRSRPDGAEVTGKGGVFERLISRRFFLRKNTLPGVFKRMSMQGHKKLYAQNVIELNHAAKSDRDYKDTSQPHTLTIALPPGSEEVTRLEVGRQAIFEGVRRGFARAYDALVEDPKERGRGRIVAKQYFPDEIMEYDPIGIEQFEESAFDVYMRENGISPESWDESFANAGASETSQNL
jgi:predicted acylesterase/phospholipase RssA